MGGCMSAQGGQAGSHSHEMEQQRPPLSLSPLVIQVESKHTQQPPQQQTTANKEVPLTDSPSPAAKRDLHHSRDQSLAKTTQLAPSASNASDSGAPQTGTVTPAAEYEQSSGRPLTTGESQTPHTPISCACMHHHNNLSLHHSFPRLPIEPVSELATESPAPHTALPATTNATHHHSTLNARRESSPDDSPATPVKTLPHSRSVPVDLSTLIPSSSPASRRSRPPLAHSSSALRGLGGSTNSLPTLKRAPTPTVQTNHIESGLTEDGFYHINQYIVEMGKWKREAIKRREAKSKRAAARAEERARKEAEGGITLDVTDEDSPSDEDDADEPDPTAPETSEFADDDDEEATILGRGSFGVVKKVFNTLDGRFYAMKIMSRSLLRKTRAFGRQAGEGDAIDSLRRELAIMRKLDNPHVVKLYEVMYDESGAVDDNVYMVMEYAEGGCVMEVDMDDGEAELEDGSVNIVSQPLSVDLARQYFRDVLLGLEYLHFNHIIHRDIKPENLLIASDGRCMITDFGVAVLAEGEDYRIVSTAGTALFMSPTMIQSGSRNNGFNGAANDVWSLGVSLFYMLYGRLPWYSTSLPEIYRMIVEEPLVFPTGLEFAHIPAAAQCLIRGMLDKNPDTRVTVAQMLQSPWVTDDGAWDVDMPCAGAGASPRPQATSAYKSQPPVRDTLCSGDLQAAMIDARIKPHVSSPPPAGECGLRCRLAKIRQRLSSWKAELKRKCELKKAVRARRRASQKVHLPHMPAAHLHLHHDAVSLHKKDPSDASDAKAQAYAPSPSP